MTETSQSKSFAAILLNALWLVSSFFVAARAGSIRVFTGLVALALLAAPLHGGVIFNFESQPAGAFPAVVDTQGGITLTATSTTPGAYVRTNNPPHALPAGLGQRALIGSLTPNLTSDQFTPVRIEFVPALSSLSLVTGDGGGDNDGTVRIRAFNSLNELVDTDSAFYGGSASLVTLSVAAPQIKYIIGDSFGGPSNLNSVYWDNIDAVPVPEPTLFALIAAPATLLTIRRRRASLDMFMRRRNGARGYLRVAFHDFV